MRIEKPDLERGPMEILLSRPAVFGLPLAGATHWNVMADDFLGYS